MGIRPKGNGFQVDVCVGGKRIQRQASNEIEAKRLETQLQDALAKGAPEEGAPRLGWTLGQAADYVWKHQWQHKKYARTAQISMGIALKYFGRGLPLDQIGPAEIDGWIEHLKSEGKSNATINRKLACLSRIFTVAHQRGAVKGKPHIERPPEGQGRIRYLSEEEEARMLKLLQAWSKDDHWDLTVVLLDTGMRIGEGLAISARDLETRTGMVSIWKNKADLPRSIPLTKRVSEVLKRRAEVHKDGPLFPHSQEWYRNVWLRLKTAMGLVKDDQFVPHCMRHTCASRLVQGSVPIAVVKAWMGHKTISVTMRYAHLAPESLAVGVAALEKTQSGQDPQPRDGVA